MSVPAWDVATDPLGEVLQPITNDEVPIDIGSVRHDASMLSTKVICEDPANMVSTTAGHTEEHLIAVSQPLTSSPEERGLDAIENSSFPELDIENVKGSVQVEDAPSVDAGHEPCDVGGGQQSIQLLDAEMIKTAVSAKTLDADIGLPLALEKEMSQVSDNEAFTITEVVDINVHQDSCVFASGNDNGDIHTSAGESNQDTTVDTPIGNPAETAIEIVDEASNTGNGVDVIHESDVSPVAAFEPKFGKGNTMNEEFASEKKQGFAEVAEVEHVSVVPKSDIEKNTTVEMEIDKAEILLPNIGQEVVVLAANSLIGDEALFSKSPSEIAGPAMTRVVEKAPNVADTTQISELETPAREVYDLVEVETTPIDTSLSKALVKTIPAPQINPAALPATDVSETHDIAAEGLEISSELVVAPLTDVQDIPPESVSQAMERQQPVHGSDSGLELTLEDNILDNALEVEIPPAETLVDVETSFPREEKPVISGTFEEVEIVREVLAPETAEELVRVSQDPMAVLTSSEHVMDDSSLAEVPPEAANELDFAAVRDVLVDPHAIGEVPQATVTASGEVAAEPLETQVMSVVVAEPSEDKTVVLVEEISVNTQPILDDKIVVVDTSANEVEAGDPDGPKLGGLANENANSQAELEVIQASHDGVDVPTVPEDALVEKLDAVKVEEMSNTQKVSLHDENSTQEREASEPLKTTSDSEFPELTAPADAVVASITAVLTDEGVAKVAEHDEDTAEPTQALLAGEPEAETMSQPLANEFAIDAGVFTVSDRSDQARTSATTPVKEEVTGGVEVATQDPQEEPEATIVFEERTVGPEAEAPATERPSIHPNHSEIGESPAHPQTSADQVVDEMSKHSLEDEIPKGMEHFEEAATKIVAPRVIPSRFDETDERIKETITEANTPQEVSVISQPALVASKDEEAETVTVTKSTPTPLSVEDTAIDKGPEPAAPINDQVEEVAVSGPAIESAPVVEEAVKTRALAEELVVSELPNEESAISTTEKAVEANEEVGEQLGSQVLPTREKSPAVEEVRVLSVEQQNPVSSAEQADSVFLVPLRGQITPADPSGSDSVELEERRSLNDPQIESFPISPCTVQDKMPVVLPNHSPDLAEPNLQGSEAQVPTAHTLSARDEVTNASPQVVEKVVTHLVEVEEAPILQYPDSVIEVQVSNDPASARVPEVQIATDAVVEPPATENVQPSISSIEQKDPDLATNAAEFRNSKLSSSADGTHLLHDGVTSIERPNSPYTPSFLVTTIGHGPIPGDPSASEVTGLILSPLDESAIIAPEEILTKPVIQIDSSVILQAVDEATMDGSQLPARPWTPSYSVHSQGSPLVTAKELDNRESDVLVDDANSADPNEPELEEMKFAKNSEQSEGSADPLPGEPQTLEGSPQPQYDPTEETRDLPGAINPMEKESNQVAKEEVSTFEITFDEQSELHAGMETSRDLPTVVTGDPTTEEINDVKSMDQPQERSQSPPWVPSYSVSTQGSPLPETRELDAIVEAGPSVLHIYEPITSQGRSVSVPLTGADGLVDGAHVQYESLGSEQRLDEPTADRLPDIPNAVSISSVNAQDSQKDVWTPSYSVTTQGVAQLSQEKEDVTLEVSPGSSPAAIASLGEALHDSSEPPPKTTSDVSNNVPAILEEQSNSDAFQRDVFERPAMLQPALPEHHQSEPVSEPRLSSPGDATPKQTPVVLNEHTAETPSDGVSDRIFPSVDDIQPESAPDSKAKPVVPRLVSLEEYPSDTLSPEPSARKRLESTTSSRFFPGGWFSSSSTKSPDETRPSLELAQGEFIPAKSLADSTEAIVSAVSSTTTESFGDAHEADSASSEEKRKWCIIM